MKESEAQNDQQAVPPESGLTRRLLQRAGIVGVIDVRPAVALCARSNNWRAQRAKMVETLKNRYGANQPETAAASGAGDLSFVAAPQRLEPVMPVEVSAAPFTASRNPVHMLASAAPQPTTPLQYHVKRPNISGDPDRGPSKPVLSSAAVTPAPAVEKVRVSSGLATATQVQRKAVETPAPRSGFPPPSRPSSADAVTVASGARAETTAGPLGEASSRSPLLQISELPSVQASALPRVAAAPMHLQRMPDVPGLTPARSDDTTASKDETPSTRDPLSAQEASAETAAAVAALPLYRKPDPSVLTVSPAPNKTEMVSAARVHGGILSTPQTVAREIRPASPQPASTRMVWRKAESNGTGRDGAAAATLAGTIAVATASPPQIMRAAASEPASGGSTTAMQLERANAVDVSGIAERVSRILAHRLRVERERRGMTK